MTHFGQADRALVAALGDVQAGDPAAQPVRQVAGRPAHPAAHVEHVRSGADASLLRQDIDRLEAAEMILVVVLQDLFGERRQLDAIARQVVADLLLVDRMGLVEVNDRSQLFLLAHRFAPAASMFSRAAAGRRRSAR